jgi:hypothetical protein
MWQGGLLLLARLTEGLGIRSGNICATPQIVPPKEVVMSFHRHDGFDSQPSNVLNVNATENQTDQELKTTVTIAVPDNHQKADLSIDINGPAPLESVMGYMDDDALPFALWNEGEELELGIAEDDNDDCEDASDVNSEGNDDQAETLDQLTNDNDINLTDRLGSDSVDKQLYRSLINLEQKDQAVWEAYHKATRLAHHFTQISRVNLSKSTATTGPERFVIVACILCCLSVL